MTKSIDLSRDSITLRREATDKGVIRDWTGRDSLPQTDVRELAQPKVTFWQWLKTPLW